VLDPGEAIASDRLQTLPSALRTEAARRAVGDALDAGDRRLQGLFERLRLDRIPSSVWRAIDPKGLTLTDVDRPTDLPGARSGDRAGPTSPASGPAGSR
jgi:hypothetical protein